MKRKHQQAISDDESNDPTCSYYSQKQLSAAPKKRPRIHAFQTLTNEQLTFVAEARQQQPDHPCLSVRRGWRNCKPLFRELIGIRVDYLCVALESVRNDTSLLRMVLDKQPDFLHQYHALFRETIKENDEAIQYALQNHGNTLKHVLLYRDVNQIPREWIDVALENDLRVIVFIPKTYHRHKNNKEWYGSWFHKCFDKHPDLFYVVPPHLCNDRTLAERALKYNMAQNVKYVGSDLMENKAFVLDMLEKFKGRFHNYMNLKNPLF